MKRVLIVFCFSYCTVAFGQSDLRDEVDHKYVNNDGVKIHYVRIGSGEPILFVHGFPDFWYGWRNQMETLSKEYKVGALDLRGYNLSDAPNGAENYEYQFLIQDIVSVIKDFSEKPVYLVAHDWGAGISWRLAIEYPELVKKLVIISVPHPLAGDQVEKNSVSPEPTYADRFVSDEFMNQLNENWLSGWVTDKKAKSIYLDVFKKANKDAMINYYKANFSTTENLRNKEFLERKNASLDNLEMPVMIVHGKKDPFLSVQGHNNTWDFINNDLSIEVLENAGHFVQQDESERLTELIEVFLERNK